MTTQRIAADANGPRATFEDIEVGQDLGVLEWEVEAEDAHTQLHTDRDYDPWYVTGMPEQGVVVPPQMQYRPPRWLLSRNYNIRGLFYKWEFENVRPMTPGMKLTLSGRISDKYIRNEREFVAYSVEARDADGDIVFTTTRTHVLDALSRDTPRTGQGIDSGIKREKI